ncbi:MAG: type II toxin-antitoxin system prevent-host-death family antitoxin [Terracidiphilus sp.]|jgi:prevent-host-death family protein
MQTAKIGEFRAKLSAYIEFVKNGGDVLILARNTPVARLVAPAPAEDYSERERRLFAKGILAPPRDPKNRAAPSLFQRATIRFRGK